MTPDYAAITDHIRAHYRDESPREDIAVRPGRFGIYTRHAHDPDLDSINVDPLDAAQIPALLADARACFDDRPVRLYVDDRALASALRPALVAAGCTHRHDLVYLAHTGAATAVRPAADITLEQVGEHNAEACEIARLKGFADAEDEPDPAEVAANLVSLRLELLAGSRYLVGRAGGEAAAIVGWDEGPHRLVCNLATRVPFRQRGIARHLLSHLIAETYADGRQSISIFTDPTDSPVRFYRRMGFAEEVYWQSRFLYRPS